MRSTTLPEEAPKPRDSSDVYEQTPINIVPQKKTATANSSILVHKNYKVASNPKVDLYNSTLFNFSKKELVSFTNPYGKQGGGGSNGKAGNPWCSLTDSQLFNKQLTFYQTKSGPVSS